MERLTLFDPVAVAEWALRGIDETRWWEDHYSSVGDSTSVFVEIGKRKVYEELHRQAVDMMFKEREEEK